MVDGCASLGAPAREQCPRGLAVGREHAAGQPGHGALDVVVEADERHLLEVRVVEVRPPRRVQPPQARECTLEAPDGGGEVR